MVNNIMKQSVNFHMPHSLADIARKYVNEDVEKIFEEDKERLIEDLYKEMRGYFFEEERKSLKITIKEMVYDDNIRKVMIDIANDMKSFDHLTILNE